MAPIVQYVAFRYNIGGAAFQLLRAKHKQNKVIG